MSPAPSLLHALGTCCKATSERASEQWATVLMLHISHLHMTSNATCSDILDVRCCGRGQRPSLSFSLALLEQHCSQCKHQSVYEQRETLWWISPVKISCKTCAHSNNQPCWYWKNKQLVQSVLSFMLFFYLRSLSLIFVQGTAREV